MIRFSSIVRFVGLAVVFTLVVNTQLFAQSGWVKEKGKGYAQLSIAGFSSDRYFSTEGDQVLTAEGINYESLALSLYAEHGIGNRLNVIVNAPLLKANRLSTTETVIGVGDIRLGLKYQLSSKLPLALSLEAELPTSNGESFAEAKEQLIPGIIEGINLPLSDGEFNVWTTVAGSQSFANGKAYGSLFFALNSRTKGLSWQWQSGAELGYQPTEKLWLIGKFRVQKSFSEEVKTVPFLYGEGTEFSSVSANAILNISEKLRFVAAYQNYLSLPIAHQNLYDGGTLSIGLAIEY